MRKNLSVSAVIGVILMVVITILIAGTVYVYIVKFTENTFYTQTGILKGYINFDNTHILFILHDENSKNDYSYNTYGYSVYNDFNYSYLDTLIDKNICIEIKVMNINEYNIVNDIQEIKNNSLCGCYDK